jgi:hypothetical protein
MADRNINVITPATNIDFLTLAELKLLLGVTTTVDDALYSMMITQNSALIAEYCNRTFAEEVVEESWRDMDDRRMFMSHWPIKSVASITAAGTAVDPSGYEVETDSGKISRFDGNGGTWDEPAIVNYTGGYILPTEAPLPLKQATAILVREEKIRMQQAQAAGIRSLTHKEARVQFYDPNAILLKLGGKTPGMQAVSNLLTHYIRLEV